MNLTSRVSFKAFAFVAACLAFSLPSAPSAAAQTLAPRITAPIVNTNRTTLAGSRSPAANPAADLGALPAATRLQGITLVFSRSSTQQAALDALVAAQQNPKSPQFHQWLTPEQFAARFGVADADIAATQAWLVSQGFTLGEVSRSRTRLSFSGTEGQVEQAFNTQIHNFRSARAAGGIFFAPARDLSIPAALAGTVLTVQNLSSYRPHSHLVTRPPQPRLTVSDNQKYFLSPPDVATIYDVNPVYAAGFTGAGQTIAVVGQSAVVTSDITAFQTALGVTTKAPNVFLLPGTGTSAFYSGDEGESDLDLEYSGAMAPGATLDFYYTGNNPSYGVFDAVQYVVDNNASNIISSSYGDCEFDIGQAGIETLDAILEQGAVQGETIISASGDTGSTDCAEDTNLSVAQQTALAVDYPASSPFVTAAGGTEFSAADTTPTNITYWTSAGDNDIVSTAIQYIPELTWNDDVFDVQYGSQSPLSSSGGGTSLYEAQPSWQVGLAGASTGGFRAVPDISLAASPNFPGYVYCTSDTSSYGSTQSGSCVNGFRDATQGYINAAGGTSFVAPILSGLFAVLNQAKGYTTGQGLINPFLYTLAAEPTTYAAAFHDITAGGNQCLAGATYCGTGAETTDYAAGIGYDQATGLGSIDFNNLVSAWPSGSGGGGSTTAASVTTLTAATSGPATGASDVITITVTSASSTVTAVPTGSVSLSINGTVINSDIALGTSGTATYTLNEATAGSYVLMATYSGDTNYSASTGSLDVNVGSVSFAITIPNVSVASGSSVSGNITITPAGYTGTVDITGTVPSNLTNACVFGPASISVTSGTTPATGAYTVYTSAATCTQQGAVIYSNGHRLVRLGSSNFANVKVPAEAPWKRAPVPFAAAALFALCCFRRRSRLLRAGIAFGFVLALSLSGLGLTGCSNNNTSPIATGDAPAGTYTISVTGTDSSNAALTATTSFTLTITN